MTNPSKSTPSTNPVGGEGGSPGVVEVEATAAVTATPAVKTSPTASPAVTNPTGGEGGSVG